MQHAVCPGAHHNRSWGTDEEETSWQNTSEVLVLLLVRETECGLRLHQLHAHMRVGSHMQVHGSCLWHCVRDTITAPRSLMCDTPTGRYVAAGPVEGSPILHPAPTLLRTPCAGESHLKR